MWGGGGGGKWHRTEDQHITYKTMKAKSTSPSSPPLRVVVGITLMLLLLGQFSTMVDAQQTEDEVAKINNKTMTSEKEKKDKMSMMDGECNVDTRVSTLRCTMVTLEAVKDSLNGLDRSLGLDRLDISRGHMGEVTMLANANRQRPDLEFTSIAIINSDLDSLGANAFVGFNSDKIEAVDLSWNRLTALPEVVLTLGKLRSLDLSHNQIASLPPGSSFNSLNALATLKLNGNFLGNPTRGGGGKDDDQQKRRQALSEIIAQSPTLSLLSFNLEPLTDTLEVLELSDNDLQGLPMQFQGRSFARLRALDLSHNSLKELPPIAFTNMPDLESLYLDHTELRSIVLDENVTSSLKYLGLDGNPLNCDCHARWLWNLSKKAANKMEDKLKGGLEVSLPPCATPFSAKSLLLTDLAAEDLCELLPGSEKRPPRFYRVSDKDEDVFPASTFSSLSLNDITMETEAMSVNWSVGLEFYYTDYDWGLIFRQIGEDAAQPNMFYKTRYNLRSHLEDNTDWSPKNENLTAEVGGLVADKYYEVCLAVVEHSTVYYVHRDLCREARTLETETSKDEAVLPRVQDDNEINDQPIVTKNVQLIPGWNSITLTWQVVGKDRGGDLLAYNDEVINVIRRITVREFGSDNQTKLFVLEDFNTTSLLLQPGESSRYYTLQNLAADTGYVVCFDTLKNVNGSSEAAPGSRKNCQETQTLSKNANVKEASGASSVGGFPITEVAIAAAVAAVLTMLLALILCCCCPRFCKRGSQGNEASEKGYVHDSSKDENENIHKLDQPLKINRPQLAPPPRSSRSGTTEDEAIVMTEDDDDAEDVRDKRSSSPKAESISMSPSMATTFEPELQSIMTDKETEEVQINSSIAGGGNNSGGSNHMNTNSRDSKFRERYTTKVPKSSSHHNNYDTHDGRPKGKEGGIRFWKSCLTSSDENSNSNHSHSHNKNLHHPTSIMKVESSEVAIVTSESKDLASSTSTALALRKPARGSKKPKEIVEEKFAEAQDYLRRPNALYPPWPPATAAASSPPEHHYHTMPHHPPSHSSHHAHHHHGGQRGGSYYPEAAPPPAPSRDYPPNMFGPGSYHTIAHYQFYKRPVDYCPPSSYDYYSPHSHHAAAHHHHHHRHPPHHHPHHGHHFMSLEPVHDYAKTLGRTRRESPMATQPPPTSSKAIDMKPVKLKKLLKAKLIIPAHHHHHGGGGGPADQAQADQFKMYTWSPYSSHMMYGSGNITEPPMASHHPAGHGGKSLDELRF